MQPNRTPPTSFLCFNKSLCFVILEIMFSSPTAPLQEVHLEVVPIAGRNHEVNLTAVVLPTEANLTVFYWWIGDNLQVKDIIKVHFKTLTSIKIYSIIRL